MIIKTKNNKEVYLRKLQPGDIDSVYNYLNQLSDETKKRFGPHPFDRQSICDFYNHGPAHSAYIALDTGTSEVIAYAIIKIGYLEHDKHRLQSYGLAPHCQTDCTFAPSVADTWQGYGIGNELYHFILTSLKENGIKRIILWGGVQAGNTRAVNYYKRNGFTILGQFTYNGENYDMVAEI
jgi:diamine N-acetyltransferase